MSSETYIDRESYGYGRGRNGYTDEDRQFFEETDDYDAEQREELLADSSESTDELGDVLGEHESDNLKPEEFGLRSQKAKNIYCDKNELYEEIRKYQREGNPTDELGEMLIKIALHMSTMARFWRYSHDIKEELVNNAILQMLKSVPKFNLKDDKKNPFGYLSMICYRDMLHSLKKHFKQDKIKKSVSEAYISKMSSGTNGNDDRLSMLKATLERNEEYNNFLKNDRYPFQQQNKQVDMFALSKGEQAKKAKLEERAARKSKKSSK